jgi:flavin-dependent dehydrogenase
VSHSLAHPLTPEGSCDVLILGGGPAGAAAGIALARAGLRAVVLDRAVRSAPRAGETLAPSATPLLRSLGVWESFRRDAHLPSPGTVSFWGSAVSSENDFIFNPHGPGWHLDRQRFDQMLAMAAVECGAAVYRGVRVTACWQNQEGHWEVESQSDRQTLRFTASFLVDATGRASWLGRHLGIPRFVSDRLIGLAGAFPVVPGEGGADGRALVESAENGWWYSAPVPDGCVAVAFMTDYDLLPEAPRNLAGFWSAQLRRAPHTLQRVGRFPREDEVHVVSASSYRLERVMGPNWLAVGDAAMAWDPLSGQGVRKALESGLLAAQAIAESRRHPAALENYATWVVDSFHHFQALHARHYGAERRWPDSVFWNRRRDARKGAGPPTNSYQLSVISCQSDSFSD